MKNIYSKTIQLRRVVITGMGKINFWKKMLINFFIGIVSPLGINVE